MLKRLFTAFLTAVMMLSCVCATAADKPENIYKTWGDFEDTQYHQGIINGKLAVSGQTTREFAEGGAGNSKYALRLDASKSAWNDMRFLTDLKGGETYDISFDVKAETEETTSLGIIVDYNEGGYVQMPAMGIGTDWSKISVSFSVPEDKSVKRFAIRFADGNSKYVVLIDNLSAVPYGLVPDADYSSIDRGLLGVETDDGVEVTKPAEYYDADFSDIGDHWAKKTIKTLAKYGYVNGVSDTEFAPDSNVTRAQFIKMMADLYDEETAYDDRFTDVTAEQWFADTLAKADALKIIPEAMKADGKINPDSAITREEAASIAVCAAIARGAKKQSDVSFADIENVSDWAKEPVCDAASLGIINGYENGTFMPKANITRAEAATILMRVVEVATRFNIYVDAVKGNDKNDGSENNPLASIEAARDMAKIYAPKMRNDITIRIRGEQYLEETFKLDETNSGQNGYKIVYTSWGDDKATITMAKKYTGFKLHDKNLNIWKVYVGKGTYSRQAYFNDVPGIRSRSVGYLKNVDYIYKSHYMCDNKELLYFEHPEELECVFHNLWLQHRFLVKKVSLEKGRVRLDMHDYFAGNHSNLYNYQGDANEKRQTPSYIENAYELLDQKGEWYLDKRSGYMYYIPRTGEDIKNMELKLPIGETLMQVKGSSYSTPVSHIAFDNLLMEGATDFDIERTGGYHGLQNSAYRSDTRNGIQAPGSIRFDAARYIDVTNCDIRHIGTNGAALEFRRGCKNVNVIGNEIYQVSGIALQIESITHNVDRGGYSPQERDPKEYTEYFEVNNNYIHDAGLHYTGAAGVGIGHARHINFDHNEIANVPYSGMHVGWGWGGLAKTGSVMYDVNITNNYIHDVMKERVSDGALIYTLGASSLECDKTNIEKNNKIIGNYLANGWQCDYVYPDEGSTSWYVKNNVANGGPIGEHEYNFDRNPSPKSMHYWSHMHASTIMWMTFEDNYATFDYAYKVGHMNQRESNVEPVNITEDGNWPDEAKAIMASAGVEDAYKDKFDLTGPRIVGSIDRWQSIPLNTPTDSGLMILGDDNTEYPLSDYNIDWWIDDPEAVTIDKDGMITAHKQGIFEAEAFITVNGVTQSQHFMLECGDDTASIMLGQEQFNLVKGYDMEVKATAKTVFGKTWDITSEADINITSSDESVVKVSMSKDGSSLILSAINSGKAEIVGTVTYRGQAFTVNVPITVISYNSDEGAKLPFKEINLTSGWKNPGTKMEDGGVLVNGSPNHSAAIHSGLVAFDMAVNPGSSWPSIAFCDSDMMGSYASNDCYMIGFKSDHIEFQKWNQGVRTMIFGNSENPIAGPGIPNTGDNNIFGYNERVSVVVGAIKEDAGTRVILNINGKNIIDYMDTGDKALKDSGFLVVYNPAPGGMVFYPYSGITE